MPAVVLYSSKLRVNSYVFRVSPVTCLQILIGLMLIQVAQGSVNSKLTDTIYCKNHPEQSYVLSLPENYFNSIKWPVIFIFDPAGRGSPAIDSFKIASANFNFILIASNSSSTGSLDKVIENVNILFEDVRERFSIDLARIYIAGFSSGSRMAMAFAVTNENVSGVIGCGAGLPSVPAYQPGSTSTFWYYGYTGDEDMNYQEMFSLRDQLIHLGLKTRLQVFHGGHQWPSSALLSDAIQWIVLQEMKSGKREKNDSLYHDYLDRMIRKLDQLRSGKDLFETARQYRSVVEDFQDDQDGRNYRDELTALENSKEYKKEVKDWEKTRKKELSYREDYLKNFDRIIITRSLPDSILTWWKDEIASLKKNAAKKSDNHQRMSSRLLNMITVTSIEWGWTQMESKGYTTASCLFKIWTVIDPEEMHSWLNLARAYGCISDPKQCITALREALKHGHIAKQKLVNDEAFASIRNDKTFNEILDKLQ